MNECLNVKAQAQTWQKLSPLSLLYFVLHFVVRFVKDGLLNLAPVVVIFVTQVDNKLFWGSVALGVFAVGLVSYSVLYYLNFRFKVTDHEVILRKGVVKKERITLNFAKIQNVNIAVPFYFGPFNLVNCTFDAAGSAGQEVGLPGIVSDAGQTMRETIFNYKQQHQVSESDLTPEESELSNHQAEAQPTFSLSNVEVAKFGLMSSMMLLVLAGFAPFIEHIVSFSKARFVEPLMALLMPIIGSEQGASVVAVVTVLVCMIVLFISASVLGAVLRFYNYQLFVQGAKIKRVSGLLERHQMSVSTSKIQAIEIKQNWIGLILRRFVVTCKQVENSQNPAAKKGQSLIIPALRKGQIKQVLSFFGQECLPSAIPFAAIHSNFWRKNFVLFCVLPLLGANALVYLLFNQMLWWQSAVVLLLGFALCIMRYKRYGFYSDGEKVCVRTGFIGHTVTIFSIYKVQQIQKTQTPMMRKAGLSTLTIQLASGRLRIPYLPNCLVTNFINLALYHTESTQRSWL
ncbi:putative membrane protein [Pseudoalteromonas ulvae UL12]|uniref:PH domain-containing protein n=1 Tax=Pseudoalteromonas ulvae TaxID=107327 RepID=UPI00186BA37B|nr:PH domain-containing protein [Pseudoalteromonas ulvae]MBE0364614.1 putative membrane protein [Pseudoalteromonas ulvae UL12]